MNRILILSLIIFFIGVASIIGIYSYIKRGENISNKKVVQKIQIIVYQKGGKTVLNPLSPHFTELQKACEELLISADDVLQLIVSPETIYDIKKKELAVEIVYLKPEKFKVAYNELVIEADHLLVQLPIKMGNRPSATIFYGRPYSSGPYGNTNTQKIWKIKELLQIMGVKAK